MKLSDPLPPLKALAHLGDAVYELWVRESAIALVHQSEALHRFTIKRVKAETQEKILQQLLPTLNEEEKGLVKRAQNMPVTSSRRSNQAVHRKATAFEAIIGYWYLMAPDVLADRKVQILGLLEEILSAETL
jgi:ribonuclease III family protein